MDGYVTADREIIIPIIVRGAGGGEIEVPAVLDTGFTDSLGLLPILIEQLGLPFFSSADAVLADGRLQRFALHTGRVLWEGQWREVVITATEGGPLLGMGLMYGNLATLELIDGGNASLEEL